MLWVAGEQDDTGETAAADRSEEGTNPRLKHSGASQHGLGLLTKQPCYDLVLRAQRAWVQLLGAGGGSSPCSVSWCDTAPLSPAHGMDIVLGLHPLLGSPSKEIPAKGSYSN